MSVKLEVLSSFLSKAVLATYAGGGTRLKPEGKKGFTELEYREGEFFYRDSFAGFLASHGQEIVWHGETPVWMCSYAGGMRGIKAGDVGFATATFDFLKAAMRAGEASADFQPRGPESFADGDWSYQNEWSGDIADFHGHEEIHYTGEFVFEHNYFGGIIKDGRK